MKAKQQQWLHFGNYPRDSCEEQEQLLSPSRSSGIWDLKALEWCTATSNVNQTESYSSNEDVVLGHANLEDSFASILSFLLLLAFKPSSSSGCHSIRSNMFSIVLHLLLLPLLQSCSAADPLQFTGKGKVVVWGHKEERWRGRRRRSTEAEFCQYADFLCKEYILNFICGSMGDERGDEAG